MNGILEGIRVIDWTVFQVGPYAAAMLADLGADVIHIEPRGRGDLLRGLSPMLGVNLILGDRHINFEEHNRNKRGIAVDLAKPAGREIMYRLVQKSDVFVTNYRQDSRQRYGMDYETLSKHNPRLIYASATAFGLKGPDRFSPGVDMLAQARSGAMMAAGDPGPPVFPAPNAGDRATSICMAFGILSALIGRDKTGVGQEISVSQLMSMMWLQGYWLMPVLLLGKSFARMGRANPSNALYNFYQCKDGKWILLCALGRPGEWERFCSAMGMPQLANDPRFAAEEKRGENARELAHLLDDLFLTRPRDEWEESLRNNDVLAARINAYEDLLDDPQVKANDMIINWDHPVWGRVKFPAFPVEYSKTSVTLRAPAPELGQHTEEVLLDIGGYSWEDIANFRSQEVI